MKEILALIEKTASYIPSAHKTNPAISAVPVSWHIEHVLIATMAITDQLSKSDPSNYKWQFNKNRLLVFGLNKIPRGKAKAPAAVIPKDNTSIERMNKLVELTRDKINTIDKLDRRSNVKHPNLGLLNVSGAMRFVKIHLKHHLKIIEDIIR